MPRISNLKNSENFQFEKLKKFAIWEIPKICNLENSKNFQLLKSRKFPIRNIQKVFKILPFQKL